MVYIIGWALCFYCVFLQEITRYRGRLFLILLLMYFSAVAFFRGSVGTDTANYELMLENFILPFSWGGQEPGFVLLSLALMALSSSLEVAVRAISLVFFLLFAVFVARSNNNERYMLMAYVLPSFGYQYSMNGLRIGLASAILLLAVQRLRLKGPGPALGVGLSSLLFHYSTSFSASFLFVSQRPWLRLSSFIGIVFLMIVFSGIFFIVDFYFMDKLTAYQEMQAPSAFSGLSKIIVIILFIIGGIVSGLPKNEKIKIVFLGGLFVFLGWVLTLHSYAGIRLLDLLSFALPLSLLASYSRLGRDFCLSIKLSIFVAGLATAIWTYRGFLLSYGEGKSPFLPYELLQAFFY